MEKKDYLDPGSSPKKQLRKHMTFDDARIHPLKLDTESRFSRSDSNHDSMLNELPQIKINTVGEERRRSRHQSRLLSLESHELQRSKQHIKNLARIQSTAQEKTITEEHNAYNAPFEFTEEEIKEAFDTLDIHKNEFITDEELRLFLDILNIAASEEEIDEMVRMADNQGIGKVFYDEFLLLAKGKLLSPIGVAYPPSLPLLERRNVKQDVLRSEQYAQMTENKAEMEQRLNFIKDDAKKVKELKKEKKNMKLHRSNSESFKALRVANLKKFFALVKFNFNEVLEVYKRNKSVSSYVLDFNAFSEFFGLVDRKQSKTLFSLVQWPNTKYIDLREVLVNWISLQNWSVINKAYLAYHVFDTEEMGNIDFDEVMDIIVWLNFGYSKSKKEKILKKIWEKMRLSTEDAIDLKIYERIIQNFGNVLFPVIDRDMLED